MELLENIGINKHVIELAKDKQLLYEPIYSLDPVKLEILKAYIEIQLKTGFIRSSKSLAYTPIVFDKKLNSILRLYINY